jgi:sarcosine/dimethylglycine N-methyltransferase
MGSQLQTLGKDSRVIDLGAGYGGSARYLAKNAGCKVTCLNISEVQNQRNRELNKEQGLEGLVQVYHGSFEAIPMPTASVDIIWSQDSFLHSSRKEVVMDEIARVLSPGGEIIFTDPMQADDCPPDVLKPVYDRLNLESMGSFDWYRQALAARGFHEQRLVYLTPQLRNHYANVKKELEDRYDDLVQTISTQYMVRMIKGLENWVDAADRGYLAWGILHFRKDN